MKRRGRGKWGKWIRWAPVCLAGLPLLAGCATEGVAYSDWLPHSVVRGAPPEPIPAPKGSPEMLPAGDVVSQPHLVPICLDTVLRLAEEQNAQVALARARVEEANAQLDLAGKRWFPDLYIGTAFYRHEGGIQNEDGTVIHSSTGAMLAGVEVHGRYDVKDIVYQQVLAERKSWQERGELTKVTTETMLDAANTYLDLLTAKTGEAIALGLQNDLKELLPLTEKMAKNEPAATVEVERIRAEIHGREQNLVRLRSQVKAASAKLVYLLGLDPCTEFVPVDKEIVPLDLVDATPEACQLVAQALAGGPGIQELQGLVNLVENAIAKAKGPGRYIPEIELCAGEGAFGGGPGDDWKWDNRFDLGLHARWNLTDLFCTSCERNRIAEAQRQQAHLAYQDLRGKLTAGVQEARETILSTRQEINIGKQQIEHALRAREESKHRVNKMIPGATATEELLSLQSLALAQIGHLNAVRDHNKAQIRLMLLVGAKPVPPAAPPPTLPATPPSLPPAAPAPEGRLPNVPGKGQ